MGARTSYATWPCPIARTVDVVGDPWTLLILREALFFRAARFADFQEALGIPTNVLTDRLRQLVDEGVLAKRPTAVGRSPHEYHPTAKGAELWSVLASILAWGNRWKTDSSLAELPLRHRRCQTRIYSEHCPTCDTRLMLEDVEMDPNLLLRTAVEIIERAARAKDGPDAGLERAVPALRRFCRSGSLDFDELARELTARGTPIELDRLRAATAPRGRETSARPTRP
jgi:DNA-binding HxlR family transcriptional regulator